MHIKLFTYPLPLSEEGLIMGFFRLIYQYLGAVRANSAEDVSNTENYRETRIF
jgi:hypothetical protein